MGTSFFSETPAASEGNTAAPTSNYKGSAAYENISDPAGLADAAAASASAAAASQAAAAASAASAATAFGLSLQKANNLSDVANAATARTNLGLGNAATENVGTTAGTVAAGDDSRITGAAQKAANLSDLVSASTARTNLGLGNSATENVGTTTGTVAAGDDSRITGAAQKASNLSDLASASTARTNLGLGGAATLNVGTTTGTVAAGDDSRITGAAQKANNLSDLVSVSTARTNLGLGTAATQNVGTGASNVVQLNASSQLPAVDGSLLTNLPTGNPAAPQGRLTLVSGTPVMTSDQTAKTVIYYTPYQGRYYPCYNGTAFLMRGISELSVTLDTTHFLSGNLYDLFLYNDSGTDRLGYGPAWSSTTARGTGAGTTQLTQLLGLWVNTVAITLRYDSTHTTAVSANQATYVGTVYATANGQTGVQFNPTATLGGTNGIIALSNAYNRVRARSTGGDSTGNWAYSTNTWRPLNGNANNSVRFVDGLQQSQIFGMVSIILATSASNVLAQGGVNLDSTTATPVGSFATVATGTTAQAHAWMNFTPQLGLHTVTFMENDGNGVSGITWFGSNNGTYYFIDVDC